MPGATEQIGVEKLAHWKRIKAFRKRLARARARRPRTGKRPGGPERKLLEEDHFSLMLFADLELEAELISLLHRCRRQIELFFIWFKCIPGCRRLLAESPSGVAIQVYSAPVAALMLQILMGRRPNKREMEIIRFHMLGYVGLDEATSLSGLEKTKQGAFRGNRGSCACRGAACPDCTVLLNDGTPPLPGTDKPMDCAGSFASNCRRSSFHAVHYWVRPLITPHRFVP